MKLCHLRYSTISQEYYDINLAFLRIQGQHLLSNHAANIVGFCFL